MPHTAQLKLYQVDAVTEGSDAQAGVTVRLEESADHVTMAVEDRGDGIDAADVPHLFRPFFRSADARRRGVPGVGLGLAVAARLAKAFGGELSVASTPGGGCSFRLRLPTA